MKKLIITAIVGLTLVSCSKSSDNNVTPTNPGQTVSKGVLKLGGDRAYIAAVTYQGKTDTLNVTAGTKVEGNGASYLFTYKSGQQIVVKPIQAVGAISGYVYQDGKEKSAYEADFARPDLFKPITITLK